MLGWASGGAAALSRATKRFTLAYPAAKPWSSTRSCQIAVALRPAASAASTISRYGSQALAAGARPARGGQAGSVDTSLAGSEPGPGSVDGSLAGFGPGPRSVDAPLAGFAGGRRPQP